MHVLASGASRLALYVYIYVDCHSYPCRHAACPLHVHRCAVCDACARGGAQARVDALRKTVAHQEQLLRTLKGQLALKEAHQKSLLLAQAQHQRDELQRGGQQQKAASLASGPAERSRNGAAASRHKAALRRTGADSAAVAEPAKASCHVASASASNLSPPTSENAAPAHDAQPLMPWTVDLSQVRARGAGPDTRMRAGAMYFLCQWRCASWTGDELHVHLFWAHAD